MKKLWVLFALFVVYGTTIPFDFSISRQEVLRKIERVSPNPFVDKDTGRRVSIPDTVQNILLFIPFGALGVLAGDPRRRSVRRVVFVVALGATLSVTVETLQLFTRDRITSSSDAMTNTVGAIIGAIAAVRLRRTGQRGLQWLVDHDLTAGDRSTYAVLVATIVVCLAAWEPFDPTLDVGSLVSKLHEVIRDPWQYSGLTDEGVAMLHYGLWAAAAAAWLRRRGVRHVRWYVIATAGVAALSLEGSQTVIASRMPSLEDATVRTLGAAIGVLLWYFGRRSPRTGWILGTVFGATAIGAAVQMLGPFGFTPTRHAFQWIPFLNYYEMTTFNSLSHAIELLLIYLPLGFVFGWFRSATARTLALALIATAAIAVPVEYVQGWVVGRYSDVTDVGLSLVGAWLGVWIAGHGYTQFAAAAGELQSGGDVDRSRTPIGRAAR